MGFTSRNPSSVRLRLPPSPTRGEGKSAGLHIKASQRLIFPASAPRSSSSPRPTSRLPHPGPRPVAGEGSLGRRTEAAAGAERTGSVSDRRPPIARAGQGEPQRKAATVRAGGSGCPAGGGTRRTPPTPFRGLKPRASATGRRHRDAEPTGPRDGAFDPSAREAPARGEGVTRTVPGPRRRAACPSWAPGVAANNGACPELMSNSSRGASAFVETVLLNSFRAKPRRPAQPSRRPVTPRRVKLFLLPLREKVGERSEAG